MALPCLSSPPVKCEHNLVLTNPLGPLRPCVQAPPGSQKELGGTSRLGYRTRNPGINVILKAVLIQRRPLKSHMTDLGWAALVKCKELKYKVILSHFSISNSMLNLAQLNFEKHKTYMHIFFYCPALRWHRYFKSFLIEDKLPFIQHIQYHDCWCPGDLRTGMTASVYQNSSQLHTAAPGPIS